MVKDDSFINSRKKYRKIFLDNRQMMQRGYYWLAFYEKPIWKKIECRTLGEFLKWSWDRRKKVIHFGIMKCGDFMGDAEALLISQNTNIKLFYYNRAEIVTLFVSSKNIDRVERFLYQMGDYFHSPVLSVVRKEKVVRESYIKNGNSWYGNKEYEKFVINWIFSQYKLYLKDIRHKTEKTVGDIFSAVSGKKQDKSAQLLLEQVKENLKEQVQISLPVVFSHNDLHFGNILCGEDKRLWLIDYEYADDNVFFFDFMNFFMREAAYRNDWSCLEAFFEGAYDAELEALFLLMRKTFCEIPKIKYCYLYVLLRFEIYENNELSFDQEETEHLQCFVDSLGQRGEKCEGNQ